jgi:hypothetical protein
VCRKGTPERRRRHVVRERSPPVDLDDREQLAVAGLQLRVTGDVDFLERERQLVANRRERVARAVAQVATGGVVEDDVSYG